MSNIWNRRIHIYMSTILIKSFNFSVAIIQELGLLNDPSRHLDDNISSYFTTMDIFLGKQW